MLGLLAVGRSNQQIADELVVVLDTVKKHVGHILDKLGRPTAPRRSPAPARWGCCGSRQRPLHASVGVSAGGGDSFHPGSTFE